jgi:hypothetical protein
MFFIGFNVPSLCAEIANFELRLTQPPIQWVSWALSPRVKRQAHGADHTPSTSAEVKKTRIYTSTAPCVFMAQCLIS